MSPGDQVIRVNNTATPRQTDISELRKLLTGVRA